MKKLLLLLLIIGLFINQSEAKKIKHATLEISYIFENIIDGYDHQTKAIININGEKVLETPSNLQSKKQTYTINVPKGSYDFYLMMWAMYEGVWEEHTKNNNYSIDCFIDTKFKTSKPKHKLEIVFDIDTEETTFNYK